MKKILVVRNIEIEGPGTFGEFLEKNNAPYEILDVYNYDAEALSALDLSVICGVVVLGGPMNVYEEEKYPFLKAEKALIKKAIENDIPTIGICLGAQLIACVLGSQVRRAPIKEIGWYDIVFEESAKKDVLLKGLCPQMKVFQWHEDTFDLPAGAVLLAKNNGINQAFRSGGHVWGLQFHIEVNDGMILSWFDEYVKVGSEELSCSKIMAEYLAIAKDLEAKAESIYSAFLSLVSCR
ncbi:MAG: type 1 glutamine amidotransferase [Candidatus Omnitrophica bacterium]|nr:type 1 glutamine amidotransferase [Candidatus Omnitrophota bacterium]